MEITIYFQELQVFIEDRESKEALLTNVEWNQGCLATGNKKVRVDVEQDKGMPSTNARVGKLWGTTEANGGFAIGSLGPGFHSGRKTS